MRCLHCGCENEDHQEFCAYCGRPLNSGSGTTQDPAPGGTQIYRLLLIFAIVCFCGTVAFVVLRGIKKGSSEPEITASEEAAEPSQSVQPAENEQEAATETADSPEQADQETMEETADSPEQADQETTEEAADNSEEGNQEEDDQEGAVHPVDKPDNYYYFRDHTYAFYDAETYGLNTYAKVIDFCRKQNGHLAVINDAGENDFLFDLLQSCYFTTAFFGYSDAENESVWEWAEGDSDYENWCYSEYGQQPDNGSGYGVEEDYAEFAYEKYTNSPNDGTWNDAPFLRNTSRFICEWETIVDE